jgi:hypothetical protein
MSKFLSFLFTPLAFVRALASIFVTSDLWAIGDEMSAHSTAYSQPTLAGPQPETTNGDQLHLSMGAIQEMRNRRMSRQWLRSSLFSGLRF